jgi:excisionase family DNA binding protein
VGKDRTGGEGAHQRLTVAQAADLLGISEGAVRSRVKRGTLRTTKEGGRLYVLFSGGTSQAHQASHTAVPTDHTTELIRTLQEQLAAERASSAELRRIVAALTQRIPELPATSSERPPEAPETATEGADRAEETRTGAQEAVQRPWWRRLLGG